MKTNSQVCLTLIEAGCPSLEKACFCSARHTLTHQAPANTCSGSRTGLFEHTHTHAQASAPTHIHCRTHINTDTQTRIQSHTTHTRMQTNRQTHTHTHQQTERVLFPYSCVLLSRQAGSRPSVVSSGTGSGQSRLPFILMAVH